MILSSCKIDKASAEKDLGSIKKMDISIIYRDDKNSTKTTNGVMIGLLMGEDKTQQ